MQAQCSNAILSLSFTVSSIFYVVLVSSFLLHDSNAFVITVGTPHSLFIPLLTSSAILKFPEKCNQSANFTS